MFLDCLEKQKLIIAKEVNRSILTELKHTTEFCSILYYILCNFSAVKPNKVYKRDKKKVTNQ